MRKFLFLTFCIIFISFNNIVDVAFAVSNNFPVYESALELTSYISGDDFNNIYYISPSGNDIIGDGSIDNPWASLSGPTTHCSSDYCLEAVVSAGDIIYFRGGTYYAERNVDSRISSSHFNIRNRGDGSFGITEMNGVIDNYIVISAYPGETPVFTNIDHGGEKGYASFTIHANYVVINGMTFDKAGFFIRNASNNIIQNCTFGEGEFLFGDQINKTSFGFARYCNNTTVLNNYFGPSPGHSIKAYASESSNSNTIIKYNKFYGNTCGYGVINQKIYQIDWTISNNTFEDCQRVISIGGDYGNGPHHGLNIYNNAFDNCDIIIDYVNYTSEIYDVDFYDNIVLNGDTMILNYRCDGVCARGDSGQRFGEFYNNVFQGISDLINPRSATIFTNYPSYWNYNAYSDGNVLITAENVNSESSNSWQNNSVVFSDMIQKNGSLTDRFYTIDNDFVLAGNGREGNTIGGFIFEENAIRADVNQDSQINTTDAMLTLRNSLGLDMTETSWQASTTTGDVSCDDNSNSIDAMLLLRYSLGLSMNETDWCE